jgi:hypothetical protein
MWRRLHPDDRDRVWEGVQEALREKKDLAADFRIILPDGTVKYLESNTHHLFSSVGALVEAISTHVDVTERKRAQEEHEKLRQLESDLAHMNRVSMMGELAASLSHAADRQRPQQRPCGPEFSGKAAGRLGLCQGGTQLRCGRYRPRPRHRRPDPGSQEEAPAKGAC